MPPPSGPAATTPPPPAEAGLPAEPALLASGRTRWGHLLAPPAAGAICLAVALLVLMAMGHAPGDVLGVLWDKVLFRADPERRLAEWGRILAHATPILLTGLAVSVAFRAAAWNIGAEGQFLAGALAANLVGAGWTSATPLLAIPALLAASATAGALLAGLAALLDVVRRVPVVLSTLLLNAVMVQGLYYAVAGPLGDPARSVTWPVWAGFRLPPLGALGVHAGLLVALACALGVGVLLRFTTVGFRLRAVGENPVAARFAGISVGGVTASTLALSGALAGLAGGVELAGVRHELTFSDAGLGFGFTGIAVALLGRLTPLGVVASALFFGALRSAATVLEIELRVPSVAGMALQGLVIILMLVLTHPSALARLVRLARLASPVGGGRRKLSA